MEVSPGDIYWAVDQGGKYRPVIILSREEFSRGRWILAVPVTTTKISARQRLPNCVCFVAGQFGLTKDCVAQAERVALLERDDLDLASGPLGHLDGVAHRGLIRAVGYAIGADCEPASAP